MLKEIKNGVALVALPIVLFSVPAGSYAEPITDTSTFGEYTPDAFELAAAETSPAPPPPPPCRYVPKDPMNPNSTEACIPNNPTCTDGKTCTLGKVTDAVTGKEVVTCGCESPPGGGGDKEKKDKKDKKEIVERLKEAIKKRVIKLNALGTPVPEDDPEAAYQ